MIKARSGNLVILGLEPKNIALLQQGKPIPIYLKEMGLPDITIAIMYGETHDEIIATIKRETGLKAPNINPVNDKPV